VLEKRGDDRTLAELDADGDGSAAKSGAELVGPITEGRWCVGDDGALPFGRAGSAEGRDMQSRTQRRQYGEPVARLSLSIRYGQRHTRRREPEFKHRGLAETYGPAA
jgi:hypothetical protein